MPKSRRPRRTSSPASRRSQLVQMEPMMRSMLLADEAERRGDARAALEIIEASLERHPDGDFWRHGRIARLVQIATLGPTLPRWATSRWIIEQALQDLAPRRRTAHLEVLRIAVALRGGLAALPGRDEQDAQAKVIDGDWVFRQLYLYEYGGLAYFVRHRASADVVAGADHIHDWARARMGAFQLLEQGPRITGWRDLATAERVETATLGCGALVLSGEHVIGRLVPIIEGVMFETAPLQVPADVAVKVAADPDCWLDALRHERAAGRPVTTAGRAFGFLSDLPPWPCLATAFLDYRILSALGEAFEHVDREVLGRLGQLLAEPAGQLCREMALGAEPAA